MSTKKRSTHDLAELGTLVELSPLEPPELPVSIGGLDPEKIREAAVKIAQNRQQVREWVLATAPKLREAREVVADMDDETIRLVAPELVQQEQALRDVLDGHLMYRTSAWRALYDSMLAEGTNLEAIATYMVGQKFLICQPNGDGQVRIGRRSFSLPAETGLTAADQTAVADRFAALSRSARREENRKVASLATLLTPSILCNGVFGTYSLDVPDEAPDRRGGSLVIEIRSIRGKPAITVLDAPTGQFKWALLDHLGAYLPVSDLKKENAKDVYVPGLNPEDGHAAKLLWHLLKRWMHFQQEAIAATPEREELLTRTTVPLDEFLILRVPGTALCEYSGTWSCRDDGKVINNLFLLVNREERDGKSFLSIAECPERLSPFFSPCLGKEFEEGEKFAGVLQPLQAVLQAVYGETAKQSGR